MAAHQILVLLVEVRVLVGQQGIPTVPERLRTQRISGWSGSGRKQQPYKRAGSSPGYPSKFYPGGGIGRHVRLKI